MTTFAPFDIEAATQPRHVTERMEIEEFIEGEPNAPNYIRTRLRTLCEDFYRKGDPALFHDAASLEEIIRILDTAPAVHPYKGRSKISGISTNTRGATAMPPSPATRRRKPPMRSLRVSAVRF
jgi:hypothetical protein